VPDLRIDSTRLASDQMTKRREIDAIWEAARKHHEAVGRFVLAWAEAEAVLYRTLLHYAGISAAIGRSLLPGQRTKTMIESIDRIAVNTNVSTPRRAELKIVLAQMKTINDLRDNLVHHGELSFILDEWIDESDGEYQRVGYQVITNEERAAIETKAWTHKIDAGMLKTAEQDLKRIRDVLEAHMACDPHDAAFKPGITTVEPSTWIYKSPQPIQSRAKFPARSSKPPTRR
jgi:hypothetical protein